MRSGWWSSALGGCGPSLKRLLSQSQPPDAEVQRLGGAEAALDEFLGGSGASQGREGFWK